MQCTANYPIILPSVTGSFPKKQNNYPGLNNSLKQLFYPLLQTLTKPLSKETIVLPLPRKTITVHSLTFPSPGKQVINNAQEIILPKAQAWWQNQNVRPKLHIYFQEQAQL